MVLAICLSKKPEFVTIWQRRELAAMNAVLKTSMTSTRNYQDSLDLIHIKYHDLKHQIAALRMEIDEQKRKEMAGCHGKREVSAFWNSEINTGNQVLDTIPGCEIVPLPRKEQRFRLHVCG